MEFKAVLALLFIISLTFIVLNAAYPDLDDYVNSKSWDRVYHVGQGETLWDIAEEVDGEYDRRFIIAAIKKVNDIGSMINANQKLILPSN